MYNDPEFNKRSSLNSVSFHWDRISTIFPDKTIRLFPLSYSSLTIKQGRISNCFFITSLSVLCNQKDLIEDLFITKNVSSDGKYTLRFYDSFHSRWDEVNVDDFIPVGDNGKPIFADSTSRASGEEHVIFPMILEKAYAKWLGNDYSYLMGGNTSECILDLTGLPTFDFKLDNEDTKRSLGMAKISSWMDNSLIACANVTPKSYDVPYEDVDDIVDNHAYSVLDVKEFKKEGKKKKNTVKFMEIYNPNGGKNLVVGDLSGNEKVEEFLKGRNGLIWITWNTFVKKFNRMYVSKNIKFKSSFEFHKKWKSSGTKKHQIRKATHYSIKCRDGGGAKITITLSQKNLKRNTNLKMEHKLSYEPIGFFIAKKLEEEDILTTENYELFHKTSFWNKRDISAEIEFDESIVNQIAIVPLLYNEKAETDGYTIKFESEEDLKITDVEPPENVTEKVVFNGKFNQNHGRMMFKGDNNPKFFITYGSEDPIYVFLFQKFKKPCGVGIFVYKNVFKPNDNNLVKKIGYTNEKELSMSIPPLKENDYYLITLSPFESSKKSFKVSLLCDHSKLKVFKSVKELKESGFSSHAKKKRKKTKRNKKRFFF